MFKKKIPIAAIIVTCLAFLYFYSFIFGSRASSFSDSGFEVENIDDGPPVVDVEAPVFNDSMLYYQYKKIVDSLQIIADSFKAVHEGEDYDNKSIGHAGSSYGFLGASKIRWRKYVFERQEADSQFRHYLSLGGYDLAPQSEFYVQNGNYHLKYVVWDSSTKKAGNTYRNGHYDRKQIPVRYSTQNKTILIPISKKQFSIVYNTVETTLIITLLISIFVYLGLPVQILINISKGRPFDRRNIRYFKWMSYVLFAQILIGLTLPYIVGYVFRHQIPPDFERMSFFFSLLDKIYPLSIATALFIIGKAFQRGYNLQQEQNLTI